MPEDITTAPVTAENTIETSEAIENIEADNAAPIAVPETPDPVNPPAESEYSGDLPPGVSEEGLRNFLNARHARQIAVDMQLRDHFNLLTQQAQALRQQYPDFDLAQEMQNPIFARLTAPGVGIDPAIAYEVVHHRSLRESSRQNDLVRIGQAIQAGSLRPGENALISTHMPSPARTDPRNLSSADRLDIHRRVARGERVVL